MPTSPHTITRVAPARVNLLGEHTDYTGGLVLPMAIPFTTTANLTPATGDTYTFRSDTFPETLTLSRDSKLDIDDLSPGRNNWTDYPVGVLRELQLLHVDVPAFDLHLSGNVPFGSGLSSSASVEVATAMALLAHANATLPPAEIALLCQRAENNYVHSPCGIMDQFVITAAHAGHALLLHTRNLTTEHLPMNRGALADTRIVVCNSMVKHSIAAGEYGQRRSESEAGQAILLHHFPQLRDLGEASLDQLESIREKMSPNSFKRCRHIVSDNARVRQAREAMFAGDPIALGQLMFEGHTSERDDFQCSCDEVDFLVETAINLRGCFGSRLTGGGFGGCTVNLVAADHADSFAIALKAAYKQHLNLNAQTYLCEAVDGAIARAEFKRSTHELHP